MIKFVDAKPKVKWTRTHLDGTVPCLNCGKPIAKRDYGMSDGKRDWCQYCSDKEDVVMFKIIHNKKTKGFRTEIHDELFCFSSKECDNISNAANLIVEAIKDHRLITVSCGGRQLFWEPLSPFKRKAFAENKLPLCGNLK